MKFDKQTNQKLRKIFRCEAEDYFSDNILCGYPVPDQDIPGRWHLCNGTRDFHIVKPETIKPLSDNPDGRYLKDKVDKLSDLANRLQEKGETEKLNAISKELDEIINVTDKFIKQINSK